MSYSLASAKTLDVGRIGLQEQDLPLAEGGRIDLGVLFGGADRARGPVELEVGSGKGTFLVCQGGERPHVNMIGLEYALAYWRYAADRCRRHGLANVRVIHTEADGFIQRLVADDSLDRVHIYFPDPWPKHRHHKRRLVREAFLRQIHPKLRAEGQVRIVTDHTAYFTWITEHIGRVADLYDPCVFEGVGSGEAGELVGTNFERKYRREGRVVHASALRKRCEPGTVGLEGCGGGLG